MARFRIRSVLFEGNEFVEDGSLLGIVRVRKKRDCFAEGGLPTGWPRMTCVLLKPTTGKEDSGM